MAAIDIAALKKEFAGELVTPDDPSYDEARAVWNASIDRRPAVIAYCTGTQDVVTAVRFARERGLLVSVRAGAHNVAGNATNDGGMIIDVRRIQGADVDPDALRVRCGSGLVWAELDAATQQHGLAVPGGLVSSTGVAGFTLGGGFGWISRKYGLACDNLVSAEVVTAEGDVVTASATDHPDLLWGLRGGGGNFGIVTSFEFALNPVGPEVMAGLIFFPYERVREVGAFYREFMSDAPDEVFTALVMRLAPPAPFLPEEVHGKPVVAVAGCYTGSTAEGAKAFEPLKSLPGSIVDLVEPRPYLQFQAMLDPGWVAGFQNYWKAEYLSGLPDEAIDTMVNHLDTITSPISDFKIASLGGAIARVGPSETAYAFRAAPYVLNINSRWAEAAESDGHISWTRKLWEDMRSYSAGGVYVNFMGDEGQDRVRAAYGPETYDRLAKLKSKYDPTNFFRMNQNIEPA